jgi:hypothetical protein
MIAELLESIAAGGKKGASTSGRSLAEHERRPEQVFR